MKRWVLVLVVMSACKDKAKQEPKPPDKPVGSAPAAIDAAPAPAAGDCEAKVKRLGERFAALQQQKPGMLPTVIPADVELAAAAGGQPIDAQGAVVVVTRGNKVLASGNEASLADGAKLVEDLFWKRALEAAAMDRGPKKPWPLYLWVDKQVKVADLAKLVADDSYRDFKLRLLVAGDPPAAEPILDKPAVKKAHEGTPKTDSEAITYRAAGLRAASAPCDTLPMAFAKSMTEAGPINELAVMADQVTKAVLECKCNMADFDVFEYSMLSIFGAFHPSPKWIELPKLAAGDTRTVGELAK